MNIFNLFPKNKKETTTSASTEKTSVSILTLMKAAIDENGCLSKEFVLPEVSTKSQLKFAPGAMDGIIIYHSSNGEKDIKFLSDALLLVSERKYQLAEQAALNFFILEENTIMFSYIDSIQNWIIESQNTIDPNNLYEFSVNLVRNSTHIEMIKFGLSILELLNIENDKELCKEIEVLALSDEFTIFCAYIIIKWDTGNEIIFDLAKKINGWGRIHLVARLDANTEKIKNWCLREGYKNSIMYEYSAMDCIEKSDLFSKLQNHQLTFEQLVSAGDLISSTLSNGPMMSLSGYDFGETLITLYLYEIKSFSINYSLIKSISNIADFLSDSKWKSCDLLLTNCNLYLKDLMVKKIVESSLMETKDFDLADKLGIEYVAMVYSLLESDFENSYHLIGFLFSKKQLINETIELFTQNLPLSKMATGPKNEIGLGPEFKNYQILLHIIQYLRDYVNHGEKLIICALHSPVTNCRNMALNVLETWKENAVVFSGTIQKSIYDLAICEINEEIKKRLKLL